MRQPFAKCAKRGGPREVWKDLEASEDRRDEAMAESRRKKLKLKLRQNGETAARAEALEPYDGSLTGGAAGVKLNCLYATVEHSSTE